APLISETRVFDVLDHANDFILAGCAVIVTKAQVEVETPPDWILVLKVTASHAFVNDPHTRGAGVCLYIAPHSRRPVPNVLRAEVSASHQLDAERGEGVRVNLHIGNLHILAGLRGIPLH